MRPHRRTRPLEHVLVAGDVGEIHAVQRLLRLLPADAYGQVFIETLEQLSEPPVLTAPARVTITWLAPGGRPRAVGVRVAAAVHAWLAEWQPGDPAPDREFTLWVGRAVSEHLDEARHAMSRLEA